MAVSIPGVSFPPVHDKDGFLLPGPGFVSQHTLMSGSCRLQKVQTSGDNTGPGAGAPHGDRG